MAEQQCTRGHLRLFECAGIPEEVYIERKDCLLCEIENLRTEAASAYCRGRDDQAKAAEVQRNATGFGHEPKPPQQRSSYWHECEHFKGYTARADFQCPKCAESVAARKCTLCDEPYVMIDDEKTFLCEAHKDCAVRTKP